jgi:dolichol-phosphate mannosyltransferase
MPVERTPGGSVPRDGEPHRDDRVPHHPPPAAWRPGRGWPAPGGRALSVAGLTVVVLPTYQEAENVEGMLAAVLAEADREGLDMAVVVVDDSSPDGTADLAERAALREPRISVLRRAAKEGIGPAYIDGFRRALAMGAERIVEMDCDFSHDPRSLPDLIRATEHADLALGSRYVPGGGVARWSLPRRLISRGGCLYAQLILGVSVRDLTGGFKCFRRAVLEALPLDQVAAHGYGFQVEVTYRAILAGFRVVEVPIVFSERVAGTSKMNRRIVVEAAALVPRLRLRRSELAGRAPAAQG